MRRAGLSLCSGTCEANGRLFFFPVLGPQRLRFGLLDRGPRRVDAGGGRDRPDLIEGNVASSHRQNSEGSAAGYPEARYGDDGKNDGYGDGLNGGKAMTAKPTSSCNSPSRPAPPADWPGSAIS